MSNNNVSALRDQARGWIPRLRERCAEIESARQLPQDIADDLARDGFYRLLLPAAYGGLETDPLFFDDIIQTLAQGDASAAWCVMIGATTCMTAAYMPPSAARETFQNASAAIHAGVFAPTGSAVPENNGYRVSGRWQWGSGSPNASRIWGGCAVLRDGQPELMPNGLPLSRMMMFDRQDVELLDTWDVSGLCGTGSTDFAVRDVFVPHAHSVSLVADTPLDRPLYKFPVFSMLASGVCCVMLGIARAAIDELVSFAGAKTPQGMRKTLANRPETQMEVARAESELRSAHAWLREATAHAWNAVSSGSPLSQQQRGELRLASAHAGRMSASAVTRVYELGGGTSVYRKSPLQRHFRDVHVAARHMMVGNSVLDDLAEQPRMHIFITIKALKRRV
jgi:alkylation response protein AidB-like acyl-CoA dehydrogenase